MSDMVKKVERFITTDPKELVGKLDPKRLQGIDLQDSANIFIVDTVGRYVKDPNGIMTGIKKIENKLGSVMDSFMDTPFGEMIKAGRDMLMKGLDMLKESGIIGPDGKLNLDNLLDVGLNLLGDIGSGILDTIGSALSGLVDLGDLFGITDIIKTVGGWLGNVVDFFDSLVPGWVKDLFGNLNWDNILGDTNDDIYDQLRPPFNDAVGLLGDDWYWYDKSRTLYNYDTIAALHPTTLRLMTDYTEQSKGALSDEQPYFKGLKKHYDEIERVQRAMRRTSSGY